ncbi:MAG TPA: AAA family ATPase [Prosthecobacter sp.]|nr:AAA family ATPase [Prosthecobacter sp.]HRK12871.1 AAA family ATPase [Prosthecobacter sp.]
MISQLTLENFKAFGNAQAVPVRPLTLIFGPNSGGKSSVLHSLKWAKHAVKSKSLTFESPGGRDDAPDFGGFLGAVFGKDRHRRIRFGFLLPSRNAPDYRVSFELGLWTRELKRLVRKEPEPPNEIKDWVAAQNEFIDAETEASLRKEYLHNFVFDEDGNPVRDDNGELIDLKHDGSERIDFEALAEKIRQYWDPRLEELWNTWRSENAKPGISEKVGRYCERLEHYHDWLDKQETDPVVFGFEIAIGENVLLKAERKTFDGFVQLTKVSRALSAVWSYMDEGSDSAAWEASSWSTPPPWVVTHPSQVLDLADLWDEGIWSGEDLGDCLGIEFQGLIPSLANQAVFSGQCDLAMEKQDLECLEKLIRDCRVRLEGTMTKMSYLGPLRTLPPRSLLLFEKDERSGAVADAWLRLRDDSKLRDEVNRWIGSGHLDLGYRYESKVYCDTYSLLETMRNEERALSIHREWNLADESYESGYKVKDLHESKTPDFSDNEYEAVNFWNDRISEKLHELVLRDLKNNVAVSNRDVGVGISQLIPVIVHALAEKGAAIAVEQPELHLHPALQAKLGDLFIESALGRGNTFVLETHSEHLILRLLRRIRETTEGELPDGKFALTPDQICVLYVEPGEQGSKILELPVTPDGDFSRPWPQGFFEERSAELF